MTIAETLGVISAHLSYWALAIVSLVFAIKNKRKIWTSVLILSIIAGWFLPMAV